MGSVPCVCSAKASAGDMAPRLWECPEHGKTGFSAFDIMFEQQTLFTGHSDYLKRQARDEFWLFCMGILVRRRAECRVVGEIYFDEDHLWKDVRKELDRIAKLGHKPTVKPVTVGGLSPRAFGAPDHPQPAAAPAPDVKKPGWFARLAGSTRNADT
ncbi:hypothetical protein DOMOVOI_02110 [Brevundimonas phage vB_BpoS-Domovoi]|uniref:Uncharacterized protein n=1 Tax=Brevundimonas phage vB_BpoS-Domovoi TaxID=2948598 RepID=A0A9E7MQH3_9CAUD|nr:hypothetical protein DOMOVOI_02110 [Brevundimonas phage vB_BpoS-Domovoi]